MTIGTRIYGRWGVCLFLKERQPAHVDLLCHELGRGPTSLAGARYQKSSLGVVQPYGGKSDASGGKRDCPGKDDHDQADLRRERMCTVWRR